METKIYGESCAVQRYRICTMQMRRINNSGNVRILVPADCCTDKGTSERLR